MIETVISFGNELANKRTHGLLRRYRDAVRQFVKYALENSRVIKDTEDISGEISKTVETVDRALADLTEVVLARETPRIQILSRLELIQGLLVDFLR